MFLRTHVWICGVTSCMSWVRRVSPKMPADLQYKIGSLLPDLCITFSIWPAWGLQSQNYFVVRYEKKLLVLELSLQNYFERVIFHWLWAKRRCHPKFTNWQPFKLQNSNGRGGSIFEPHPSNFGNHPIF